MNQVLGMRLDVAMNLLEAHAQLMDAATREAHVVTSTTAPCIRSLDELRSFMGVKQ